MGFPRQEHWSGAPLPSPTYLYIFVVQSLRLFATPWTTAYQASVSFTISQSLLEPIAPSLSSVDDPLGCFHVLATVNSTAVNFGVRVSSSYFFHFLQIHAQEWNFWVLMGAAFLVFLRNLHAVFHSGCTSLHSPCGKTTFCLSDGKYKTQEQGAMFHAQRSVWSRSP